MENPYEAVFHVTPNNRMLIIFGGLVFTYVAKCRGSMLYDHTDRGICIEIMDRGIYKICSTRTKIVNNRKHKSFDELSFVMTDEKPSFMSINVQEDILRDERAVQKKANWDFESDYVKNIMRA